MLMTRRSFTISALSGVLSTALPSSPPLAKAAKIGAQAPGYFRLAIGDAEVTVLADGHLAIETKIFGGDPPAPRVLGADTVVTSVNGWLINTGDRLVLVDTGTSTMMGDTLGKLAANLKAAGYTPDQVDAVVMTHLHPDHAAGLIASSVASFPNASLHVAEAELGFWTSDDIMGKAPDEVKPFFTLARNAVKPYADAGKLMPFKPGELLPGLTAVAAPGHTPGHTMLRVSSGNEQLLLWGDIVHNAALQFHEPGRSNAFDVDQPTAVTTRQAVLDMASADRLMIAGSHLPFPGLGHVTKAASGYHYVAQPWTHTL